MDTERHDQRRWQQWLKRKKGRWQSKGLIFGGLFILVVLVSCGSGPGIGGKSTPTAQPGLSPGPTSTPYVAPTEASNPTPAPTSGPTVTPTPDRPTPSPTSSPCQTPAGVTPVSALEIDAGNTGKAQIALTFDAGGPAAPTSRILDILASHQLHTTWFLTGQWAQQNPELARRVLREGHEIGNHSMTHPDLTTLSDEQVCQELTQADQVISSLTGQSTRPYFRPPYGARNDQVRQLAANLGYRTVYWTIDTIDWRSDAAPQTITERVMSHLSNGAIILMHAGSDVEAQTLDQLIPLIQQKGYQIVTVTQLLQ